MTPTPSCSWLARQEKLRIAALSCVKRWEHCVEVAGVQVVLIRALPFCQVPHDTLDTHRISQFYRSPVQLLGIIAACLLGQSFALLCKSDFYVLPRPIDSTYSTYA